MMTHHAAHVSGMENPTEWLGKGIRRVDDSRDVAHNDIARCFPVLDGKVLNVNVSGAIRRNVVVDHEDSRHIVFVDWSGRGLRETELMEDGTEVSSLLSSGNSSNEFSLSRACGHERLCLGTVGDCAASE